MRVSTARRANVAAVIMVALGALATARYGYVSWRDRMPLTEAYPYRIVNMADFKDAVWLPARDLSRITPGHVDPYHWREFLAAHPTTQGYSPYTPSHLALAWPFGQLGWSSASAVWTLLAAVCMAVMSATGAVVAARLVLARSSLDAPTQRSVLVAAGGAGVVLGWLWRPSAIAIGLGQPSAIYGPVTILLSMALLARCADGRWRDTRSDVGTGLLAAISLAKPQLGIQTVIALVTTRRWRALGIAVGVTAVLSLVVATALAGGPGHLLHWLVTLPEQVSSQPSRFDPRAGNAWIDVSAFAYRCHLRHGAVSLIGPLAALVVAVAAVWGSLALRRAGLIWTSMLLITAGLLLALPHSNYDSLLLFALLPAGVAEWWLRRDALRLVGVILLALVGFVPNRNLSVAGGVVEPAAVSTVLLLFAVAVLMAAARRETVRNTAVPGPTAA